MSYSLFWRSPGLSYVQKQNPITVPAGSVVSNAASLRFTGKGATNYGKIQQENLLRLLENFAGGTQPDYPTVGQTWYDTTAGLLKVCVSTAPDPVTWRGMNATQVTGVGQPPPTNPNLGDSWFSQTGTSSGVLYVFTGIGRYPQVNWDAVSAGYYPPLSTSRGGIILNAQVFGPPNTNYNEAYIHGFTGSTPADVDGLIDVTGALPKGALYTQFPVVDALIVFDQSGTMAGGAGQKYFAVQQTQDGRWFYDNNSQLREFTPATNMFAIGRVTVAEQDDQTAPGISAGTIWNETRRLTDFTQALATKALAAIGGWEQVWPVVETHGGRAEYEYLYNQLASLIGDPLIFGGSGAEGRYIQNLTDMKILDASMQLAWKNRIPQDTNANVGAAIGSMKVDPNSQDWDKLLSACRFAVNRLELPSGMVADLATQPFVQDGLPADASLLSYTSPDPRTLSADRRVRTRTGAITVFSQYQETVNVLRAALQQRYLIRGLLESSGVGNAYNGTVYTVNQAQFFGNAGAFPATVTHGLVFEFPYDQPEMQRFFTSGQVLQLVMSHSGVSTPADSTLKSLTDNYGRIRITCDNTFVMSPAPSASLTLAPTGVGFQNFTAPGVNLAAFSIGASTIVIRGLLQSASSVLIYVDVTGGGALSGTFNILWSYIQDNEQYNNPGPTRVYPIPNVYIPAHKMGSGTFT